MVSIGNKGHCTKRNKETQNHEKDFESQRLLTNKSNFTKIKM